MRHFVEAENAVWVVKGARVLPALDVTDYAAETGRLPGYMMKVQYENTLTEVVYLVQVHDTFEQAANEAHEWYTRRRDDRTTATKP